MIHQIIVKGFQAMRFGCCVALASFVPPTSGAKQLDAGARYEQSVAQVPAAMDVLEQAGCDFAEFGVGMVAPELPDEAFERFQRALESSGLVAECFNSYIPPDIKLVGHQRDWQRIEQYVRVSAERVAAVGGKVIVFGSGGARSIPDGFDRAVAEDQLIAFCRLAAEHAQNHGIRIAIEPLNTKESNVLTSVEEGVAFVKRVDRPDVKVLADFYHMMEEDEPFSHMTDAGEELIHVHVADTGRLYPGSGDWDYPGFYAALRDGRYDSRISVECNWKDFRNEVAPAMTFLRES
ncbi:MAG: sugar phosphate isomerase/epimerase [Candidatus Poribacteria bacterium]|nr:sugar phosphate isomerase/epimerase [Candidatus Poribacteria bacterium]